MKTKGLILELKKNNLEAAGVISGSSAQASGIKKGDRITAFRDEKQNWIDVTEENIDKVFKKIIINEEPVNLRLKRRAREYEVLLSTDNLNVRQSDLPRELPAGRIIKADEKRINYLIIPPYKIASGDKAFIFKEEELLMEIEIDFVREDHFSSETPDAFKNNLKDLKDADVIFYNHGLQYIINRTA